MLRQEKSRLDAQTLSQALTIAWDLLAAADHPAHRQSAASISLTIHLCKGGRRLTL
jgi:hypothetical protein